MVICSCLRSNTECRRFYPAPRQSRGRPCPQGQLEGRVLAVHRPSRLVARNQQAIADSWIGYTSRQVDKMGQNMTEPKAVRKNAKNDAGTQIVGIRMTPALAQEVKMEATKRGITLKTLFAELWEGHKRSARS